MSLTQSDKGHDEPGDIVKCSEGGEGISRKEQTTGNSSTERPEEVVRKAGRGSAGVHNVKHTDSDPEHTGEHSERFGKIPPPHQRRHRDPRGGRLRGTTMAGARRNKNGSRSRVRHASRLSEGPLKV
jgi:hypothetical protein